MFVVKKYYKGKQFSAVENPSPELLAELLVSEIRHMSEDPSFSISIGVKPQMIVPELPLLLV